MSRAAALLLAGFLATVLPAATPAQDATPKVTIYRCTDDAGRVTLRDTPCRPGSDQEVRAMQRPKDAPTAPAPAVVAAPPAAPVPPPPRLLVLRAPRPMYECVTPDGERYTSDSPEGRPRWAPVWSLDLPVQVGRNDLAITGGRVRIGDDGIAMQRPLPYAPWPANAVVWLRDDCHALPQAETCARLRDQVRELDRRIFNAQPSLRAQLRVEKRGVQARIDADCP